ncbi:MAG TPA: serine hydrolase domain-containing protein [Actinocrinis sp.]|nr:serine hydrolase domain-containing protein [Actinocrinis sp.]
MTTGLSPQRLEHMHEVLSGYVTRRELPGLVAVIRRHGRVYTHTIGTLAFDDPEPMTVDTPFRIASLTKPVTAVAAMILVEGGVLRLDDPVDPLLPELAGRRVLTDPAAALDQTGPAERPITLRDLLTFRAGIGMYFAMPGTFPLQKAMEQAELQRGPEPVALSGDEWLARLAELPLAAQPGTTWMYHTSAEILGLLIERATGQSLDEVMRERIFTPLGMTRTGFQLRDGAGTLPTCYVRDQETAQVEPFHSETERGWHEKIGLNQGGAGLVSTAGDYASFLQMLLSRGAYGGGRILSRPTVELMTMNHLAESDRGPHCFLEADTGWGLGLAVTTHRTEAWSNAGRFGWNGGTGTTGYADPAEDLVGVLMTQRFLQSPSAPAMFGDFWTQTYAAIED